MKKREEWGGSLVEGYLVQSLLQVLLVNLLIEIIHIERLGWRHVHRSHTTFAHHLSLTPLT